MRKILILEPNPYHNEILPGYVKYFVDLGFVVDVYVRNENRQDNAFCRYRPNGELKFYNKNELSNIIKSNEMEEYDFVMFSSMEHCEGGCSCVLSEIEMLPKSKYGILGVYHSPFLIDKFKTYELENQSRLFCISDFQIHNKNLASLAPIYFGQIKLNHTLENRKKILCIGTSVDFVWLNKAYYKLTKTERKNIEIRCIGKTTNHSRAWKILSKIYHFVLGIFSYKFKSKDYINFLGHLDFSEMFDEIENCDYLLCLINPHNETMQHYFNNVTSGIRQLILGFRKPAIINNDLSKIYNISKESSVIFEEDNLIEGIKNIYNIDNTKYKNMILSLTNDYDKIYLKSKNNLIKTLEKITKGK